MPRLLVERDRAESTFVAAKRFAGHHINAETGPTRRRLRFAPEPSDHPAVTPYKNALLEDGIPATIFQVDDVDTEFERLEDIGVKFTQVPTDAGTRSRDSWARGSLRHQRARLTATGEKLMRRVSARPVLLT